VVEIYAFGEKTHSTAATGMTKVLSEQTTTTARGPHETHGEVNRSTLARAVWSQKTENLSGLHGQAESVESTQATLAGKTAILFRKVLELEDDGHRRLF
jgi:hypothetical protein